MIITLLESGSKFDLPLDLKLNIEIASPVFSKAGAMSLPVSLPLTDNNRRLLQFPDRLDMYDSEEEVIRAIPDISVIVKQGSWQQVATMSISGCSEEAVESTLYFNESNIWSKLDAVTVPQAMAGLRFGEIPEYGAEEYYRTQLIAQFYDYMIPPYLSGSDLNNWLKEHDFIVAAMKTKDGWLNEPACVKRYVTGNIDNWTLHEELMTKQCTHEGRSYKMVRMKSEFEWYTTTACYGKKKPQVYDYSTSTWMVGYRNKNKHLYCTGFLRLDVVIKQIFNYLGYTLEYDFDTYWRYNFSDGFEVIWNQIVVLNNTMDAIYPGFMPYSALVPEVTAKEFVAAVQAQFGVVFTLQSDNKTVKMQFTEKILKLFAKTNKLASFRDKQISFNATPDYMPIDEMDNIKAPEYLYDAWCESFRDGYCVGAGIDPTTIDYDYGECFSFELDGACQRTTTSRVGDTDETKTSECPLAFGVCTNVYNSGIDIMEYKYYSALIDYIYVWSRQSPEMEEPDSLYINTTGYGIYRELNTEYNTISEHGDRIILTTVLTTLEVNQFDFTTPYVIQGRLCWPIKLQFELENSDEQHVTIEFIAGRKL